MAPSIVFFVLCTITAVYAFRFTSFPFKLRSPATHLLQNTQSDELLAEYTLNDLNAIMKRMKDEPSYNPMDDPKIAELVNSIKEGFTDEAFDKVRALSEKVQSDPSYDVTSDLEAMNLLEPWIPEGLRDLPNAIERVKVAVDRAITGADSVEDFDSAATEFPNRDAFLSTPASEMFRNGVDQSVLPPFDTAEFDRKLQEVAALNPDIPIPQDTDE